MTEKTDPKHNLMLHSRAKVEFYKNYLERYLRILCLSKYINNVNIYDVFCGMGIYEDGGKGSPIVAFEAINSFFSEWNSKTDAKVTLIFNDKSLQNINKVKNYIDIQPRKFCKIKYFNKDIEEMFEIVQDAVAQTKSDTRNIIFIDPYGYKNIRKDLLAKLMENKKTEIILFLPISHMYRFTKTAVEDETTTQYEPLRQFVYSFFPENHKITTNEINIMEYIQYITTALKFNNQFYTTSYYIERDATNHFALFFISPHIFGFEKILEVKWLLDEDNGKGFRLPEAQGNLFTEYFSEEAKTKNAEKLEKILLTILTQPKTNNELYEITLTNEYLPTHTTKILKKWQNTKNNFKVIDIETNKPACKNFFYISYNYYKQPPKVKFIIEKL